MKRMLINATQPEEVRVALVDGQRLYDLDIETTVREQKKANIYKAKVVRIEPSLEAVFIDYGAERNGFLPFKEIDLAALGTEQQPAKSSQLKDVLAIGQEFIVQISKEERGNKGAAMTTFVSLAGRYLVLMPNKPQAAFISRQIDGNYRTQAREAIDGLTIPAGVGMILRTAGVGKTTAELQWDLDYLCQLWQTISSTAKTRAAPFLIYQESEPIIRVIRDYLRKDMNEIWIDDAKLYQRSHDFMSQFMPNNLEKLKLYKDSEPLFTHYQIDHQIESAFARKVSLPSGGAIIIDHTEALISIDINSARATKGSDIEETAFNTNLEAVKEIARQIRLRDIGGLIVIDFIDMANNSNQRNVENALHEALRIDRARIQMGRISRFGLLEMSRQRLRPSLDESSHIPCPRCDGQGTIRDLDSLNLSILRIIEETAMKPLTAKVVAHVPVDVATLLLNEKRQMIHELQQRLEVEIIIIPDPLIVTPQYSVQRVPVSQVDDYKKPSYQIKSAAQEAPKQEYKPRPQSEQAAVAPILPRKPSPTAEKKPSFIAALLTLLGVNKAATDTSSDTNQRRPYKGRSHYRRRPQHNPYYRNHRNRGHQAHKGQPANHGANRQRQRQNNGNGQHRAEAAPKDSSS